MPLRWRERGRLAAAIAALVASSLGPLPSFAESAASPVVVLAGPVRVEARLDPRDSGGGRFVFDLDVVHDGERCALQTGIVLPRPATLADAAARLRRTIGWRSGYLFVRTECGGGNAWKCASEAVFAIRGGRLTGLGTLAARSRETGIGTSWRGGVFRDADTELEINPLTSHAAAPWFELRLRERGGRLVADTRLTWAVNRRAFAAREHTARLCRRRAPGMESWDEVVSPRLGNAAVAKYCGRTAQLATILAEARAVLPAGLFATFDDVIAKIEPGALPATSAPPRVQSRP